MEIGKLTALSVSHCLRVVLCISIAGCAPSPAPVLLPAVLSVHQTCGIDPDLWKQIPIPPQREALLDLKDDRAENPTRKYFVHSTHDTESWFENSSRDLLACRYVKQGDCGGGVLSTVIFRRDGEAWKAEPVLSKICTD